MVKKITAALATVSALAHAQAGAQIKIEEIFPKNEGDDLCGGALWQEYIGLAYDDVPSHIIAQTDNVRRIDPGSLVTMDYRMDRLNVYVDAEGLITRVRCG